jgi:riboflavin kinase / FMN adenylyltransferase
VTNVPTAAIDSLERAAPGPHVVTIGNFDGVHRGHVHLIQRVIEDATGRGARSLVITFEPHPTQVLRPDIPFERLTAPEDKLRYIRETGVDDLVIIPFDREFAALEPAEFLELLTRTVQPAAMYVGEGFRAGSGETIRDFGDRHGFETTIIPRIRDGEAMISSSSVREALKTGDIATANRFLGRRYLLRGRVERGAQRGRELGFPTANLVLRRDACIPADGIYAGLVQLPDGRGTWQAMVYVGTRPTFDNGSRIVEANLLDFSGDLYHQGLEIEFVAFIRGDQRFDSVDGLTQQMRADEADIRRVLSDVRPEKQ